MMLPERDAFTTLMCPACSAKIAMINSVALPRVAFSRPPTAGPE